ncbi:DUF4012 domain-containing protein [Arthrobacter sp. zg-Y1219]|uniref:DUF4012 domain-containing protein n=1 Tax=Arthrobacter sp. zg-Y1219 TaxID=3049067 RepID=UPI0024C262EE|nr:DUF4012 domain-containing protein [Arthrobacter sp. zg-Y1219]MDK1360182.1 DUF4012 domain-containing protein [Arthrobacter sp. zg-Y1219]
MNLVPQLRAELEDGDHQAAELTFATIRKETTAARSTTTAAIWKGASFIPVYGVNFSAVREVAVSADDIAVHAAAPLLERYTSLSLQALSPVDGRIDFGELQNAAPSISKAANTVRLSHERMASIDVSRLLPELARPVGAATEELKQLTALLNTASSSAQLLPALLGADEPRDYLVLVQNSSEARATGGIPGALAILHTDDGRISLGEQSSAVAMGAFRPPMNVDPEQLALFTDRLGTQMQNVNLTPDFPTAAQSAKLMWEERNAGQTIDGVLALDPVVLSHLLEATGPVNLSDPEILNLVRETSLPSALTSDNVVPTLLSDVYHEIEDPQAQDAYFSAVAAIVFSAFTEGQGDGGKLVKALAASAEENRLYLWSSHSAEQDIIASTPLHGSVTGKDAGGANFGVYFNDGTGAKMDYYVNRTVQVIQACSVGEYGQFAVRVTATNNAPADAATSLPAYVTGGGVFGVEPGRIRTNYVVYGPSQAFVETATVNGQPVPVSTGKHGQRPVGTVQLELGPGETSTIDLVFSGVVQGSEPQLRVSPTIQPLEDVVKPMERETCG